MRNGIVSGHCTVVATSSE